MKHDVSQLHLAKQRTSEKARPLGEVGKGVKDEVGGNAGADRVNFEVLTAGEVFATT